MDSSKRIRRSKSNVHMNDLIKQERDYKLTSPDKPVHECVESYFSTASGFTNFRGLLNLMIILLVVSNIRVALENLMKYGILIRPFLWAELVFKDPYHWPCVVLLIVSNVFILTIYFTELLLEKKKLPAIGGMMFQALVLFSMLFYSSYVILKNHPNPLFSAPILGIYTVVFLKLFSYVHVNKWCREGRDNTNVNNSSHINTNLQLDLASNNKVAGKYKQNRKGDYSHQQQSSISVSKSSSSSSSSSSTTLSTTPTIYSSTPITYPGNLTLSNLYYFMVAPTLCYELNFPKTLKIRKRFLIKRLLEMIFIPQLIFFMVQQWIMPLLHNSVKPFSQSHIIVTVERLLKLSIPNHLIWLMSFYTLFHSSLNVCAELTYFGDRLFYKDWWNAITVTEFWSTWNIPVHRWARRHIFIPLLEYRYSKLFASVIVFLISALFHELLISVPLRMFRIWSFSAMIGQVPFALFVSKFCANSQMGNFAVWISLIIGQPLAMMMYFHDYYIQNLRN